MPTVTARTLVRFSAIALGILLIFLVVGIAATQTRFFREWVRTLVIRQAAQLLDAELAIGRLEGSLWGRTEAYQVSLRRTSEETGETLEIADIDRLVVDYSLWDLLTRGIIIDRIVIERPVIHLVQRPDGRWNLATLLRERERPADAPPGAGFTFTELQVVDGVLHVRPLDGPAREVRDFHAVLGLRNAPDIFELDLREGRGDVVGVLAIQRVAGRVKSEDDEVTVDGLELVTPRSALRVDGRATSWRHEPRLEGRLQASPLMLAELGPLVPALAGSQLAPAIDARVSGPLAALDVKASVEDKGARAAGDLRVDAAATPRHVSGQLQFERFDLARVTGDARQRTNLTGRATVDLRLTGGLPSGEFAVEATDVLAFGLTADTLQARGTLEGDGIALAEARVRRQGATATAAGRIAGLRGPGALTFDLRGSFDAVDLRRLPAQAAAPKLESRLSGRYEVSGRTPLRARVALDASTLEDTRIAPGTTVEVTQRPSRVDLVVDGHVEGLNPARLGRALRVPALADPRYEGDLTGPVHLEAGGPSFARLEGQATGTLADSRLQSARVPALDYAVRFSPVEVHADLRGEVSSLRPAEFGVTALEDTEASGRIDLRVGFGLGDEEVADRLRVDGTATLANSTVLGLRADTLEFEGRYEPRRAQFERLLVTGPDVEAEASGTLVLGGEGVTDLSFSATLTDLSLFSERVGQPLEGTLQADGRATGRDGDVTLEGTFTAAQLAVGALRALGAKGTFGLDLPQLDTSKLVARADVTASALRAGGQEIPSAHVAGTYANRQADFRGEATLDHRELRAAGTFALDPVQTLRLDEVAVRAGEVEWSLPPGGEPAVVRRTADSIEVEGLVLTRGDQRMAFSGHVPTGDEGVSLDAAAHLRATFAAVRVADVVPLARRVEGPGPEGTLTGAVELRGALRSPEGGARIVVTGGQLRPGVAIERVEANASVGGGQVVVDADVVQGPGATLAVNGRMPWAAVLQAGDPEARKALPLDLTASARGVQLALLEAVTSQVADVTGTFNGEVRARGTLGAPQIDGELTLSGGSLRVPATGGTYNTLEGRLAFTSEHVDIAPLSLMDENGDPLMMRGRLGLSGFRVTGVEARIQAERFEVLDNEFGEIEVHADLQVGGSLTAPIVSGDITVQTGRIEADELLEELGARRPRPTGGDTAAAVTTTAEAAAEPERVAAGGAAGAAPTQAPPSPPVTQQPGASGVALDVRVNVPDNLVVRGRNLRRQARSMALGNLNITIGGQIQVSGNTAEGGPLVVGSLRAVRGFYSFQGRRFEVERDSEVRFVGALPIDPALRVTAHREISGVDTRVHVRGPLSRPEITLSSNPPLDQSDILSLIVFNEPANSLGTAERTSLAERAATLAAGALTGPLSESVARALDLDYVELQAATDNGRPSVRFGEQIGDRAFVGYEQQFGAGDIGRLTFEYRLTEFLRLVSSFASGSSQAPGLSRRVEQQAIDLFFTWTY